MPAPLPLRLRPLAILAAVLSTTLSAAPAAREPAAEPAPVTQFTLPPAVSELAAGFAAAVSELTPRNVTLHYREGAKLVALRGITAVQARNGVLIITFSAGDKAVLPADSVALITDGPRPPRPGASAP
ncbi:MAG: hypothetical protein JNG83_10500 [Opitutaceae bacterium]|nr:hypothetical protein [Opitutaceae bacterium]